MLIERIYASDVLNNGLTVVDPGDGVSIKKLVTQVLSILFWLAGVLAVIYLIYSGILYITAAGNPDAAKKGQQGIINAIIGIVIVVLAIVIVNAIGGSQGVNSFINNADLSS